MRARFFFTLFSLICVIAAGWPAAGGAMTVFSPVISLQVAPGTEQRGVVKIYNETDTPQALEAKIERFTAADQSGTPAFVTGGADQFLSWFSVDTPRLDLPSHEVRIIPFTVRVPASATPGGYYAAIFWQPVTSATGGNIRVTSRVGTLVLLTVTGDVREQAELESFQVEPQSNGSAGLPVSFGVTLKNTGNVHLQPAGTVTITSWWGKTTTLPLNAAQRAVLPDTTRRFTLDWGTTPTGSTWEQFWNRATQETGNIAIGKYTAQVNVLITASSSPLTATQTFWVIPVHALLGGGVIILLLILFVIINRAMHRLRHRHASPAP